MKIKKITAVLLTLLVFCSALAGCSGKNEKTFDINSVRVNESDLSEVEIKVDDTLKENEFCGSAAISINEQEVYNGSIGYEDPIKKKKLSGSTKYHLNALTKNITAASTRPIPRPINNHGHIWVYTPPFL